MSELLTALVTLAVMTILSRLIWGTDYFGGVVKGLTWLLTVVPLTLLRDIRILGALEAAISGILCLVASFPGIRPRPLQR